MASTARSTSGSSNVATHRAPRLSTETEASPKTTEFLLTVATMVGILLAAALIEGGDSGGTDEFIARQAWLYVAIVVGACSVGRGLAKSGSREGYFEDGSNAGR